MAENILGITALVTVILNLLLTFYLLADKYNMKTVRTDKNEVVNFKLKPIQKEFILDTEILDTEVISGGICNDRENICSPSKE